jgi:hypothetical protein
MDDFINHNRFLVKREFKCVVNDLSVVAFKLSIKSAPWMLPLILKKKARALLQEYAEIRSRPCLADFLPDAALLPENYKRIFRPLRNIIVETNPVGSQVAAVLPQISDASSVEIVGEVVMGQFFIFGFIIPRFFLIFDLRRRCAVELKEDFLGLTIFQESRTMILRASDRCESWRAQSRHPEVIAVSPDIDSDPILRILSAEELQSGNGVLEAINGGGNINSLGWMDRKVIYGTMDKKFMILSPETTAKMFQLITRLKGSFDLEAPRLKALLNTPGLFESHQDWLQLIITISKSDPIFAGRDVPIDAAFELWTRVRDLRFDSNDDRKAVIDKLTEIPLIPALKNSLSVKLFEIFKAKMNDFTWTCQDIVVIWILALIVG